MAMSNEDLENQTERCAAFKTRRAHQKSRMGCYACKWRKRKCDERKPSCTRCTSTFRKCTYPMLPAANELTNTLPLPVPPCDDSLSYPSPTSAFSEDSVSFETLVPAAISPIEEASYYDNNGQSTVGLSEADLRQHYLEHTSHTLAYFPEDQTAFRTEIPALASRNKMVSYSMQALSAVCMCCDMIYGDTRPTIDAVNQVLMTGYRLYNQASAQMRESIAQSETHISEMELLLVSAVLLVPFAAASQQVSHWISSKSTTNKPHKPLSTTPRDVIVMMRGIRATVQALESRESSPSQETANVNNACPSSPLPNFSGSTTLPQSRTHVMFPIIAATSQAAYSKVQERVDSLLRSDISHQRNDLSACAAAFKLLLNIRTQAFSQPASSAPQPAEPTTQESRTGSWLRCYASRHAIPRPTEPLTHPFLGFLVRAPQAYLDLVLPLLDKRLESPSASSDSSAQLTKEQALALDIYAHWSVLMFLVEEESWWIGRLPIVTLTGMVNRYGDGFVGRLWPEESRGQWWPGSMLRILREVKGCIGES